MEGVPRIPMMGFPMRRSADTPHFRSRLKSFISNHYNEDADSYSNEIHELESLRASAVHVSKDYSGCSTLKKYFCQLNFLKSRFPLNEGGGCAVSFSWYDVFSEHVHGWSDVDFEMSCILYNIGALHSELGALDNRQTADGMKTSCTHFQCAAWAFSHLRHNYQKFFTPDVSPDMLNILYNICLAQAQECILEKSLIDNRKSTITAKVALQIVEYYSTALRIIDTMTKDSAQYSDKLIKSVKTWKKLVELKVHYYGCIAYLYRGMQSEDQGKWGERVTMYKAAAEKMNTCLKLAKNLEKTDPINDTLNFTLDVVGGKIAIAEKENEFIYHEKVPELEAVMSDVKGVSLVKGIQFKFDDPQVAGPDIFGRLVPMEAHEASSLYSEEKAKILRTYSKKIEEKNEALDRFVLPLQLEQLELHVTDKVPQELIDCCAALSVNQDAVKRLSELMTILSNLSRDVEANLEEIQDHLGEQEKKEKEYQEVVGKRPPNNIINEIARELQQYQSKHSIAAESNEALHEAMVTHVANLNILMKPFDEVMKHIPRYDELDKNEEAYERMKKLAGKVEEMRKQREMLEGQLRDSILNDDITKSLVVKQQENMEDVFKEELQKHDKVTQLLDQNLHAQDNIIRALTEANAEYADTRRATVDLMKKRDAVIQSYIKSYESYDGLIGKCNKGIEFYTKLNQSVEKLLQRARSVCKVQNEERDINMERIIRKAQPAMITPVVPNPASGQMYNNMMGGQFQGYQPTPTTMPSAVVPPVGGYQNSPTVPTSIPGRPSGGHLKLKDYLAMKKEGQNAASMMSANTVGNNSQTPPPQSRPYDSNPQLQNPMMSSTPPPGNPNIGIRPAPVGSEDVGSKDNSACNYSAYPQGQQPSAYGNYGYYPQPQAGQAPANSQNPSMGYYNQQGYNNSQSNQGGQPTPTPSSGYYQQPSQPQQNVPSGMSPQKFNSQGGPAPQAASNPPQNFAIPASQNYPAQQLPSVGSVPHQTFAAPTAPPVAAAPPQSFAPSNVPPSAPTSSPMPQGNYQNPHSVAAAPSMPSNHQNTYTPQVQQPMQQYPGNTPDPRMSSYTPSPTGYHVVSTMNNSSYSTPVYSSRHHPYGREPHPEMGNTYSSSYGVPLSYSGSSGYQQTDSSNSAAQYPSPAPTPPTATSQPQGSQPIGNPPSSYYSPVYHPTANTVTNATYSTGTTATPSQVPSSQVPPIPASSSDVPKSSAQVQPNFPQQQQQTSQPPPASNVPANMDTYNPANSFLAQYVRQNQGYVGSQVPSASAMGSTFPSSVNYNQSSTYPQQQPQQPNYSQPSYQQSQSNFVQQQQPNNQYAGYAQQQWQQQQPSQPQQPAGPPDQQQQAYTNQQYQQQYTGQNQPYYNNAPPQAPQQQQPQLPYQQNQPAPAAYTQPPPAAAKSGGGSNMDLLSDIDFNAMPNVTPLAPASGTGSNMEVIQPPVKLSTSSTLSTSVPTPSQSATSDSTADTTPPNDSKDLPVSESSGNNISDHVSQKTHSGNNIFVSARSKENSDSYRLQSSEQLDYLVQEVKAFQEIVDSLSTKTSDGHLTRLDMEWKKLIEIQNATSVLRTANAARSYRSKNRFPDILPYDQTRVPIEMLNSRDDYINASFIKDLSEEIFPIIATQAPMRETADDFWQMIWDQNVETVICLCNDVDISDSIYWPKEKGEGAALEHRHLKIVLQTQNIKVDYVERTISVTNRDLRKNRVVVHLQFTGWTGHAFPSSPSSLVCFANDVSTYYRKQRNAAHPVVIHCIAGVGKTGVFSVLAVSLQAIANKHEIPDLTQIAAKASEQRKGIMNDKEYLRYVYKAVLYYCQTLLVKNGKLPDVPNTAEQKKPSHVRNSSEDFLREITLDKLLADTKIGKSVNINPTTPINGSFPPKSQIGLNSKDSSRCSLTAKNGSIKPKLQYADVPDSLTNLDPATFSLKPKEIPKSAEEIATEKRIAFENSKGSLFTEKLADVKSDPFGGLDPLWNLKK